jgi:ABC-type transport system involved in multi-copper enzyme maturation permease subunit
MAPHKFLELMRWEFEEYFSFPLLVFLVASAIVAVLFDFGNSSPHRYYTVLYYSSDTVFLILTVVAGVFFARSYAGSIGRGETKVMLSYPIKRSQLFLAKFTALFTVIFGIYASAFSAHIYIDGLTAYLPMILLSFFALLLQLMLVCSVAIAVSMVTKSELMSILSAVMLLTGINTVFGYSSYLTSRGRLFSIFQYFGKQLYDTWPLGDNQIVTANEVCVAILVPLAVFSILIAGSFLYFSRYMEVD